MAIALLAVAYLLSFLIRLALSRSREYLADAGSVELTKNPDAMISALRKIEGRGELPGATSSVMEMCIDNPREGFGELFDTHPSVESRITAIMKFAGGHDPGPLALPRHADDMDEDGSNAEGPWGSTEEGEGAETSAQQHAGEARGPWSELSRRPAPVPGPWGPHRS
jgi:heat shock protein HtpX